MAFYTEDIVPKEKALASPKAPHVGVDAKAYRRGLSHC